jgi:hypothetical protein
VATVYQFNFLNEIVSLAMLESQGTLYMVGHYKGSDAHYVCSISTDQIIPTAINTG